MELRADGSIGDREPNFFFTFWSLLKTYFTNGSFVKLIPIMNLFRGANIIGFIYDMSGLASMGWLGTPSC